MVQRLRNTAKIKLYPTFYASNQFPCSLSLNPKDYQPMHAYSSVMYT